MQYLVLPSFIFGFLLTVFPRWMGLPELDGRGTSNAKGNGKINSDSNRKGKSKSCQPPARDRPQT